MRARRFFSINGFRFFKRKAHNFNDGKFCCFCSTEWLLLLLLLDFNVFTTGTGFSDIFTFFVVVLFRKQADFFEEANNLSHSRERLMELFFGSKWEKKLNSWNSNSKRKRNENAQNFYVMVCVQVPLYVHYWIQLNACSVASTLFINVQIENPHHYVDFIIGISKFKSNETTTTSQNVERQKRTKFTTTKPKPIFNLVKSSQSVSDEVGKQSG